MSARTPMRLYCTRDSTFSRRVRVALREKGLEVEELETDAAARERPEFLSMNPFGRIPVLVDGELVLYESTAILEYLEELHPAPPLVPPDFAGRALVAMHAKLCDLEFTPHAIEIQRPKRFVPEAEWDRAAFARAAEAISRHYEFLEGALIARAYLVGDRFSLADLCYLPFLHFRALLDVPVPARVEAYAERLAARPSAQATIPRR